MPRKGCRWKIVWEFSIKIFIGSKMLKKLKKIPQVWKLPEIDNICRKLKNFDWLENSKKFQKNSHGLGIAKNSEICLMAPTKWGNTRDRRERLI